MRLLKGQLRLNGRAKSKIVGVEYVCYDEDVLFVRVVSNAPSKFSMYIDGSEVVSHEFKCPGVYERDITICSGKHEIKLVFDRIADCNIYYDVSAIGNGDVVDYSEIVRKLADVVICLLKGGVSIG